MEHTPQVKDMMSKALERYEKNCKEKFNLHRFAKQNGLAYSTLYVPMFEDRMPRADTWLKIMIALGAVEQKSGKLLIKI